MEKDRSLERFKDGTAIYGDDFSQTEIDEWFADEAEGYAGIVPEERKYNFDAYKLVIEMTLYRWLRETGKKNCKILSYGGVRYRTSSDYGAFVRYYRIGAG